MLFSRQQHNNTQKFTLTTDSTIVAFSPHPIIVHHFHELPSRANSMWKYMWVQCSVSELSQTCYSSRTSYCTSSNLFGVLGFVYEFPVSKPFCIAGNKIAVMTSDGMTAVYLNFMVDDVLYCAIDTFPWEIKMKILLRERWVWNFGVRSQIYMIVATHRDTNDHGSRSLHTCQSRLRFHHYTIAAWTRRCASW